MQATNSNEKQEKKRAYAAEYRRLNAEKIKIKGKERYRKNREKVKEASRLYRQKNIAACRLKFKEYRARNADRLKEYKRRYYEKNREALIKKQREREAIVGPSVIADRKRAWSARVKARNQAIVDAAKVNGCVDCGDRHQMLHLHHKNPRLKQFTIGDSMCKVSPERMAVEVAKCECLCFRCHAKRHKKGRIAS